MKISLLPKTFVLVACLLSALSVAAYDFVSGGIYYKITSSANMTVEVTYYSKTNNTYSGTVTIPEKVTTDGKTYYVTAIGEYAFVGCSGLRGVNFTSERTTKIGNYAFQGCNGMTSFYFPAHIASVGNYAFSACYGLKSITFEESTSSLSLGYGSSKGQGYSLFYDCPLESLYITRPLSYSTGSSYGYAPFANVKTLKKVRFGSVVKAIWEYLFAGCSSLNTLEYDTQCKPTEIRKYAFWDCDALTESNIHYPVTVTTIGEGAFQACSSLTSYTIPNHVTTVGTYAFRSCTNLSNIVIKPSVTSIGNYAFYGCTALTGVTIEESETSLSLGYGSSSGSAYGLFHDCPLVSVFIGRPLSYSAGSSYGYSPFGNNATLVKAHFGNPVKYIHNYLFTGCSSLKTLVYNSQCKPTGIGNYAFWSCTALTESDINYPESVTTIGEGAFRNCTSLQRYTIPNHVTSVGTYAFQNCTRLANIVIKPSVTSIGNYAFYGCTALTGVTIEESETSLSLGYGSSSGSAYGLFHDCPLVSVFIGRPLSYSAGSSYGYSPFGNNATLVKAHFGNPVKYIHNYLFTGCSSLKTLVYNSQCKPTGIGNYAFWSCTALTESDINYPESVTTIGEGAFRNCTSLQRYTIPNHVTSVGTYAFQNCTRLANIVIKPSVTSIGNYAFYGCTALTGVTIEESETSLSLGYGSSSGSAYGLFHDCPLVSVFIGRPLSYSAGSSYGYSPFGKNLNLQKACLGKKLASIPNYIFYGCTYLDEVTSCAAMPPTANANCFANYDARLYVPMNSVNAYKYANVWKDFSSITGVDIPDDSDPVIPSGITGDVNGDGVVNITDVADLIEMLLNK